CPAEFLQLCRCVRRDTVDVDARSQLPRELRIFWPASNGGDLVTELLRELDTQVAEPADSLDCHEVARHRAAVSKRVEGRDPRTEQWPGFRRVERLRHPRDRFDRRNHVLLIAAVVTEACDLQVGAVHEVAAPAREAGPARRSGSPRRPSVPAPLSSSPSLLSLCAALPAHTRFRAVRPAITSIERGVTRRHARVMRTVAPSSRFTPL